MSSPNLFCREHSNAQLVAKCLMNDCDASACGLALGTNSDSISVALDWRAFANETDKPSSSHFNHTTETARPNDQLDLSTGVANVSASKLQSPSKCRKTMNLLDPTGLAIAYSEIDDMAGKINLAQTVAGEFNFNSELQNSILKISSTNRL